MELTTSETFDVVPTRLAVQAMRDNGYKNAAYALAELIDNSIQAGATQVELICGENSTVISGRQRTRVDEIAVLDNGVGMNGEALRKALQFGNGTRLNDRSGMGRFGMGLPSSSISQCQRVEVWSWQEGMDSALYSYLDLGEIESGIISQVPAPLKKPIPEFWLSVGQSFGESGTLVVWKRLDRCLWKTGRAIIRNSEFIIGRMYRRFIENGDVVIRMATIALDNPKSCDEANAIPNDPLYLMVPTSCPAPFDERPMFEEFGEKWEIEFLIGYKDAQHSVWVRFTHACEEARLGDNAGSLPHGKHAKGNVGVSIVRAGRELELSQSWVKPDVTERWWGVEIEFPPELDEVFGVTNNKQSARYLADAGAIDLNELAGGRSVHQLKEELEEEGDPIGPLIEIAARVEKTLNQIRRGQKQQSKGKRGKRQRHLEAGSTEAIATAAVRKRREEGYEGESDRDENLPPEQRQEQIEGLLRAQGLDDKYAHEMAATTISSGLKYIFTEAETDGAAFFTVKPKAGVIHITLNMGHPAYPRLVEALDCDEDSEHTTDELRRKLESASSGLRLLLGAWARMEDECPAGDKRMQVQDLRTDWGRVARVFLSSGS